MNQPLWQKLSTLATLDKKIASTSRALKEANTETAHVQKTSENLLSQIENLKKTCKDHRKKVDGIELRIKEIDQREAQKKKALEAITHEKEYKALKKEILTLELEHQNYEDQLVSQWHDLETSEKKRDEKKVAFEKQQTKEQEDITTLKVKIEKLEQELWHASQERDTLTANLPAKWLDIYNKMKDKVSDPIVPAINSSCSSCYYQVLQQDLALLRKNALVHCRNCYRLLYAHTEESKQSAQEAY